MVKIATVFDELCKKDLNIMIGESAQDNVDIIHQARQFDLWFHVKNVPSCHVVLQLPTSKSKVSRSTLIHCKQLCINNSSKSNDNSDVICSSIKHIKKGEKLGSVYSKSSKTTIL